MNGRTGRIEERMNEWNEKQQQQREEWVRYLEDHLVELRENRFPLQNLHTLASVYFGLAVGSTDPKASHEDRIEEFVGGDPLLVNAVMLALKNVVWRADIPDVYTVSLKYSKDRMPWIVCPALASMDLIQDHPELLDEVSDSQRSKVLAIYYCYMFITRDYEVGRACHDYWLQVNPQATLDVLYRCAKVVFRNGSESLQGLYELDRIARDIPGISQSVNNTRLRLLGTFPARILKRQLMVFDYLIGRCLRYSDEKKLETLADNRLAMKSTATSERVRWLVVVALLSDGQTTEQLRDYVAGREIRVQHLAEFLNNTSTGIGMDRSILEDCRSPKLLGCLIELLGYSFRPMNLESFKAVEVTLGLCISELIYGLIRRLSGIDTKETNDILTELAGNPRLARWRNILQQSQEQQNTLSFCI